MSYDPAVVREWIYAKLTADAPLMALVTGGWHHGSAPEGSEYPIGTFHMQAGGLDTTVIGGGARRILSNGLWMVRVTGKQGDSDVNLDTIAAMFDDLLDRASGDAGTGHVYGATREVPWGPPPYSRDGTVFVEAGGLYRIWVQDPIGA